MKPKINISLFTAIFFVALSLNLLAPRSIQAQEKDQPKVQVYYFHLTTRCATCRAIESEAKQDVKELFGEDVSFSAFNLDDPAGEEKGKELGVNSQSLIAVKDGKKINLTNEGFLYARTNPEKFKAVIEEKIKPLL